MWATFVSKGVWPIVNGKHSKPLPDAPDFDVFEEKQSQAAGMPYLRLEESQKVHVKDLEEDARAMWERLEQVHLIKRPGQRFNAYDSLFSIRKKDDESLTSLLGRVDQSLQRIKDLRPKAFTIDDLDQELSSMALICSLPAEYNSFVSSLLLLLQFDCSTLNEAFTTEENQRRTRNLDTSSQVALSTSLSSTSTIKPICDFCGCSGHLEASCFTKQSASTNAKKIAKDGCPKYGKGTRHGANTSETTEVVEYAGNASIHPSDPTAPLESSASSDWNTDTGVTSHMTPHRHWFFKYTPLTIPIRLADHQIIYSAGVGSVRFQPMLKGVPGHLVEFEHVLHVPLLCTNLLALLYLTCHKWFKITIDSDCILFRRDNILLLTATINDNNTGYLDGHAVPCPTPASHFAHLANGGTNADLDLDLWHRCLGHLHIDALKALIRDKLVDGIVIKSPKLPDPICEPCIAGKQHRGPIPQHATFRAKEPLHLVHTDLHGPMLTQTPEGYRYWAIYVNDATRFWVVFLLRRKSEAFSCYQQFKAYAERQLGVKLRIL